MRKATFRCQPCAQQTPYGQGLMSAWAGPTHAVRNPHTQPPRSAQLRGHGAAGAAGTSAQRNCVRSTSCPRSLDFEDVGEFPDNFGHVHAVHTCSCPEDGGVEALVGQYLVHLGAVVARHAVADEAYARIYPVRFAHGVHHVRHGTHEGRHFMVVEDDVAHELQLRDGELRGELRLRTLPRRLQVIERNVVSPETQVMVS
mmetsp:Transcript_9211/g.26787  ORF Transcript_9211/g.26787 Transcript_9211/m.26787 type:complete len:200 (+) Transcript_9211:279-878(+)